MSTFADDSRPMLGRKFRLQWEEAQGCHVLLYPEGMVKLNRSAGEILSRCSGTLTVGEIVTDLERAFAAQCLGKDVMQFLALAATQGWIEERA
jgi:pyrroloquinoline quinone biosynthesis protein D